MNLRTESSHLHIKETVSCLLHRLTDRPDNLVSLYATLPTTYKYQIKVRQYVCCSQSDYSSYISVCHATNTARRPHCQELQDDGCLEKYYQLRQCLPKDQLWLFDSKMDSHRRSKLIDQVEIVVGVVKCRLHLI